MSSYLSSVKKLAGGGGGKEDKKAVHTVVVVVVYNIFNCVVHNIVVPPCAVCSLLVKAKSSASFELTHVAVVERATSSLSLRIFCFSLFFLSSRSNYLSLRYYLLTYLFFFYK